MNKHIELVKKWLADPESVSKQELKDNARSAYDDAVYTAYADNAANAANAAYADNAAYAAYIADAADTAYWVKRYEGLKEYGGE